MNREYENALRIEKMLRPQFARDNKAGKPLLGVGNKKRGTERG